MPRPGTHSHAEMTESLRRSRAGHISAITCTENSIKDILLKSPSSITTVEKSRLEFALDKCNSQQVKIEGLNEQIIESINQKEYSDGKEDELTQEELRFHDTDFKVGSLIKVIPDVLDKIREASDITQQVEVTNAPVQERTRSGRKLPKITLPTFNGNYSERIPFFDLFHNTVD